MAWKKLYHTKGKSISSIIEPLLIYEEFEPIDENATLTKVYCRYFGCGKRLSLIENLCGDKCSDHKNLKPFVYHNGLL